MLWQGGGGGGNTTAETLATIGSASNDLTGFFATDDGTPPTDTTVTFDDATRTLSIAPTGASFNFYVLGVLKEKTTTQTKQITDTEGVWAFYFDSNGDLQATQTASTDLFVTNAFASRIYWDATNKTAILKGEERHMCGMDGITHAYLHQTFGARYGSGMAPGDFSVDQDGSLAAHAQFSMAVGYFWDEDIYNTCALIASTVGLPIFYKDGANANWRKATNAGYSMQTTGTGRLAYNEFTGGAWQQTEVTDGRYVLCHIFAVNDASLKYIAIQGEAEYQNQVAARQGAINEITTLVTGTLPTIEFVPVGTVIYQTSDSYSNAVKARIRTTDEGANYVDLRTSEITPGISPTDHGNLSGLGGDDHLQYALLAGRSGGQTQIGGTGSGDDLEMQSTSNATKGKIHLPETTDSSDKDTGAMVLEGGLGVEKNINSGANVNAVTALKLNGNNINTGGTLSNVAYLDQANIFTNSLRLNGALSLANIISVTVDTAISATQFIVLADASSNPVDITLPTPSVGRMIVTGAIDTTNAVRILPNAAETINGIAGAKTVVINYEFYVLISDGTNWFIIANTGAVLL